jgi:hypothetical protein
LLRAWGHYQLTAKPIDAELIFVVRPGRLASASSVPHASIGRRPAGPAQQSQNVTAIGVDYGAEVGPIHDYLAVYVRSPDGKKLSNPLWEGSLENGLDTPDMPLFQKFKDQVETALKK